MNTELSIFAARLREQISLWTEEFSLAAELNSPAWHQHADAEFSGLAVMLFTLQFKHNLAYRRLCEARGVKPADVMHWTQIPPVPTAAFKEFELSALHPEERLRVFHSSGTTEQRPSRHFHSAESLALYEASLWPWISESLALAKRDHGLISLTPPASRVPHSSLVHMFDFVAGQLKAGGDGFLGELDSDGAWRVNVSRVLATIHQMKSRPILLVGTAFSYVHLLDAMVEQGTNVVLPAGSIVVETGGYKGRSRTLAKADLHELIQQRLGVSGDQIRCEYGMSELSSQAYDSLGQESQARVFKFPPWARMRVISPETKREVAEGELGLLQIFDLANAFSVLAIQTEDLAVRRDGGFELIGRVAQAELRGCSLMSP